MRVIIIKFLLHSRGKWEIERWNDLQFWVIFVSPRRKAVIALWFLNPLSLKSIHWTWKIKEILWGGWYMNSGTNTCVAANKPSIFTYPITSVYISLYFNHYSHTLVYIYLVSPSHYNWSSLFWWSFWIYKVRVDFFLRDLCCLSNQLFSQIIAPSWKMLC